MKITNKKKFKCCILRKLHLYKYKPDCTNQTNPFLIFFADYQYYQVCAISRKTINRIFENTIKMVLSRNFAGDFMPQS
jgi:hypothetical protein